MPLSDLSQRDRQAIREAIIAVLVSPDLDPVEYDSRYGVTFQTMKKIVHRWPHADDNKDDDVYSTINGCLNETCNGIIFEDDPDVIGMTEDEWPMWFSVSRDELRKVYERWEATFHGNTDSNRPEA
jgi:hypothetical protein